MGSNRHEAAKMQAFKLNLSHKKHTHSTKTTPKTQQQNKTNKNMFSRFKNIRFWFGLNKIKTNCLTNFSKKLITSKNISKEVFHHRNLSFQSYQFDIFVIIHPFHLMALVPAFHFPWKTFPANLIFFMSPLFSSVKFQA